MTPENRELTRWMCTRHHPPVLLAILTNTNEIHIKVGARHWRITGFKHVIATCPKCGSETILETEPQRATESA